MKIVFNFLIARWLETSFLKFNRHEYYTAVSYIIRLSTTRTFKIIWSSKENMVQFYSHIYRKVSETCKFLWIFILFLKTLFMYHTYRIQTKIILYYQHRHDRGKSICIFHKGFLFKEVSFELLFIPSPTKLRRDIVTLPSIRPKD
jgi:hypothetical protein